MNVQSLSVVVPAPRCVNDCPFCVSKMHCEQYPNLLEENLPDFRRHLDDYLDCLAFARDNGCNTVMLTGTSEPQQNKKFLTWFGMFMRMMKQPFRWIEMQTTGIMLDRNYLQFLRDHVGVNVISLSLSSLSSERHCNIIGCPENLRFNLLVLCRNIKELGFTLRLSVNLTNEYDTLAEDLTSEKKHIATIFNAMKSVGADQITFRVLYADGDTPQAQWVKDHAASETTIAAIKSYVCRNGIRIGTLPYGQTKYDLDGMSVVIDEDCMAKHPEEPGTYKYLVLRPDCALYSSWDSKATRIF